MSSSVARAPLAALGLLAALSAATALIWFLEAWFGLTDASPAYLLAVVAVAVRFGTVPALLTALGGFAAYNFLFTHPRFTFVVADSGQLLNLVLLLVVGVVVGQLAGSLRSRAHSAEAREREARVLFNISRALATSSAGPALRQIMETLVANAGLEAAWVAVGGSPGAERPVTDVPSAALNQAGSHMALQRVADGGPSRWMAVRPPGSLSSNDGGGSLYRVPLEISRRQIGGLWGTRPSSLGVPGPEETRMLAAAADQIGQALEQDRLRGEATSAELARRSEQMKSVLLESVSHDLRTPLAAIRAAAGALIDAKAVQAAEQREVASAIDSEAARMDRLVGNLLEISRIEAGGLTVDLQPYALDDLLATSLRPFGETGELAVDVPDGLLYVLADAVLLDQVLGNVVENALRHGGGSAVRLRAAEVEDRIRVTVEDAGPGVPADDLPHLFEKFYRVQGRARRGTRGVGLGLAVARGLVEAMGGDIDAAPSPLGGLAVTFNLQRAEPPSDDEAPR
jgi:two-component system sensor histidine kinase KdpD